MAQQSLAVQELVIPYEQGVFSKPLPISEILRPEPPHSVANHSTIAKSHWSTHPFLPALRASIV